MLGWILFLLSAGVIVANLSFVLRWALPERECSVRRRQVVLQVFAGVVLLFFISCFTSLWGRASEYLMVPVLIGMGTMCCFCVGWAQVFSRFRVVNTLLSVLAFTVGMCFFSVVIIVLLSGH